MVAFDLPTKWAVKETIREAAERGLLTLACGHRSIRLIPPPLDITKREIDLGADILLASIEAAAERVGVRE